MMLTPEQEELVEKNKALAYYILKKLNLPYDTFEYSDAEAAALFGLCKAAKTFDESRGIKFSTYASKCINNEILMLIGSRKKYENEISINTTIHEDDKGNALTFENLFEAPNSNIEEHIYKNETIERLLTYALNHLQPLQCISFLYYLGGYNQIPIGKILGVSQSYVSRVIKQSIKRLKYFDSFKSSTHNVNFSVSYYSEKYIITFDSNITQSVLSAYLKTLNKLDSNQPNELRDFFNSPPKHTIGWNGGKLVLYLSNTIDSFTMLAMLMQEFYSYTPVVRAEKRVSEKLDSTPQKEKELSEKIDSPSEKIREYVLSLNGEFSFESVVEYFGDTIDLRTIKNHLQILKLKGWIRSVSDGKYLVIQNKL